MTARVNPLRVALAMAGSGFLALAAVQTGLHLWGGTFSAILVLLSGPPLVAAALRSTPRWVRAILMGLTELGVLIVALVIVFALAASGA